MTTMKKFEIAALGVVALAMASCSQRTGWSVEGSVDGAPEGTMLAVEANNAGRWYVLDSVATAGNGSFSYQATEPSFRAEIMRLTLPGSGSIYFPVDSIDAVTVLASAESFSGKHTLSGTHLAQAVSRVDSIALSGNDRESIRRELANIIAMDTTGVVAFYAVGKSLDNQALFDSNEAFGNRVYGAATQVFATHHPLDTRGLALRQAYFQGRRALGHIPETEATTVLEVPERGTIDIVRYDNKGVKHSLDSLTSQGKVVLLSFTGYSLENSPAYNSALYDLYTKYHEKGLEIYQIAFDADEVAWKNAAVNLPWITVWNAPSDGSSVLSVYNVGALPMTYIINRQGDLTKRVIDPSELSAELAKLF